MSDAVKWNRLLRWRAAQWLRYERRCMIVAFERPPQTWGASLYRPDVLGIDRARNLIEVEIKVTMADFRADKEKWRHVTARRDAHQFYYAVPSSMVAAVKEEAPEWAGVLSLVTESATPPEKGLHKHRLEVKRKAPKQPLPKAPVLWCMRMAENQSGTLVSLAREMCGLPYGEEAA